LFDFLSAIRGITWAEYKDLIGGNAPPENQTALQQIKSILNKQCEQSEQKEVVWPPPGTIELKKVLNDQLVQKFISKRKLDIKKCLENNVRIGVIGRYTGRFIIPIHFLGEVVAYQARDMTGKSNAKYLTEGLVSNLLYNVDNVNPTQAIQIAEGIFSSWALPNSVASFSASLSTEQINLMRDISAPCWILCWDIGEDGSDAYWKARPVLNQLVAVFGSSKIKYVMLPHGEDPDSLGKEKMKKLLETPLSL
jgi:DNA primase